VQWDEGTNGSTFTSLVGTQSNYIDYDYTITTGVIAGQTY